MFLWKNENIFVCLLLFLVAPVISQEPYFKNYLPVDGLPTSLVYDAFQDSKGYLWFSTDIGVSRFNGYEFENFTTEDGLSDNEIFQVFEDSKNRIWFLTFNGKLSYYKDGQFYNADNSSFLTSAEVTSFLTCVAEDQLGNLFFGSIGSGVLKIDSNQIVSKHYENQDIFTFHYLWADKGQLFALSNNAILSLSNDDQYQSHDSLPYKGGLFVRADDDEDYVYLSKQRTLFLFDKKKNHLRTLLEIPEIKSEIIRTEFINGSFWLGTRDGVFQLTFEETSYTNYKIRKFLGGKSVSSILQDKEDNWWFTTLEGGIFFAPSIDIIHYQVYEKLLNNKIICLSEDQDNRLWVGSVKNNYAILENDIIQPKQLFTHRSNSGLEITNIRHFEKEETWIVGKGSCLQIKEDKKRYLMRIGADIQKDEFGYYWFAHRVVSRFTGRELEPFFIEENDPQFERKEILLHSNAAQRPVFRRRTLCIEKTPGIMWAGTSVGLFGLSYNKDDVHQLTEEPLIPYKIAGLKYDPNRQLLWAATGSHGVFAFRNDSIVHQINVSNGLSSNICSAIHIDKEGAIWIGTALGFDKLVVHQEMSKALNFNSLYGLDRVKVNDIQSHKNDLYIATDDGLTIMPRAIPFSNNVNPVTYINALLVNNKQKTITPGRIYAHDQNAMEFQFLGLSFQDQGNLTYQYRLSGLDNTWRTTSSRSMQYRSLPPGKYRFEVKTINGKGRLSTQPAFLDFQIDAPVWQKAWFIMTAIIITILLLYFIWKVRLNDIKKKFKLKQKLIHAENEKLELEKNFLELEMRALRQQMNPHFIYNALNTIKGYYAESKIKEANSYISTFARILRLILENNDKFIPLEKEMQLLQYYIKLAQIRYPGKLNYHIEVDDKLQEDEAAIPPMLLQPFVENAIIHGLVPRPDGGHIHISFKKEKGILISKVKDDGIGRLAAAKLKQNPMHQSKAIIITQERLDIINKNYNIANALCIDDLKNEQGTEVIIKTPYTKLW